VMARARYDGLAAWYDQEQSRVAERPDSPLQHFGELVGPGNGLIVDVGCGTGLPATLLRERGWTVGGVDFSRDQLAVARPRCSWVLQADARHLPMRSSSVTTIAVAFLHTDVDSFDQVMIEIARVLAPGGHVIYLGVHPCFVGHHVDSPTKSDVRRGIVGGYRDTAWVDDSEQFGPGIRSRVGARHVPLGEFFTAFINANLVLDATVEFGDGIVPWMLGVKAHQPH
jgi:SAM-dependent methyltransferase